MTAVFAMTMTGCGKEKSEKVPELLEPVSTNEAYRPVTYGDIGRKVIKTGTIVPTDYCYYYETSATLSKVYVNVGDEVKKGTVLADVGDGTDSSDGSDASSGDGSSGSDLTDTGSTGDMFDDGTTGDGTESDDVQKYRHDINQKIYQENQSELDWKIKACEEAGDKDGASEARTEKAINEENNRYDNLIYEYEQKKKLQEKEEQAKLKKNGTLKAEQAGYVTYAKKIKADDKTVNGGENVVVVSDYDQPYIEITGETYKKDTYAIYKNMYTVIDGKKYDIEPYKFSNQEIAVAQSMSSMPYTRFQLKGVKNPGKIMHVGSSVSLYFSTSDAKNVLTVGNDSIYEENGQSFVYIKTDSSEKERRDVEVGVSDSNYTEIVSGLKEGDLVYYASDTIMPSNYIEYTVALDSYTKTAKASSFAVEDLNSVSYTAPCDGRFSSINVKKGQKVKKGDVLFVIDSGGGTAAVKEIDNQIQEENSSYSSSMQELDGQINDINSQIQEYQKAKKATPTDAENPLYMVEQLTCQRNVVTYNKQLLTYTHNATLANLNAQKEKLNKNNDGSGKISVYADEAGTVKAISASTDAAIKEGQTVLTVGNSKNVIIALTLSEGTLGINQKVTVTSKKDNTKKISGTCVGSSGDSARSYIETDKDGNVHITKCSGSDELKYYIKVDDDKVYKSIKSYEISYPTAVYDNVVMIPTNMIYHETSKNNSAEYDYVWLLQDGEIVKQYVTLGVANKTQTIILSGLSEGDVIAKESGSSSSGSKTSSDSESSDSGSSDDSSSSGSEGSDDSGKSDDSSGDSGAADGNSSDASADTSDGSSNDGLDGGGLDTSDGADSNMISE